MTVRFVLNGKAVEIEHVDPHVTLLQWLRESGLTGTKEGCAEGECGACAVALKSADAHGNPCYTPINSCLVALPSMHGEELVSVEGVAAPSGELHPVQRGMVERAGSQCGYCTPGFVVSLFCEYYRPGRDGYDPESISGNLCRCTGYRPIADVARALPKPEPTDPVLVQLSKPRAPKASLEYAADGGEFVRPTSLTGLFDAWAKRPNAVLLGGGTDLVVYANQRYDRFASLIALDAVPELRSFEHSPTEITLGSGLSLSHVEQLLHGAGLHVPLLEQLWPLFSSRLIRNRATLGGNLGTASPIGDSPPALLALDAELSLASESGVRRLPLREFFVGYRKTALGGRELIAAVHIPVQSPRIQRFYKVSKRVMDDISTVAGAFALDLSGEQRVERLQIAFGGVAATPVRALAVEQLAVGRTWNQQTCEQLAAELVTLGSPMTDHRGSAEYRRAMLGKLLQKFFAETSSLAEAAQ
ncbi:MAG TPA: FAD binding domain-containing protein [Polyangiales bacterium]|nr:FAD binding domain-containing protein [Polyangiales bacterium]